MPSKELLKQLQNMSLDDKILKTKEKIWDFYTHYEGKVYVSFSGGKDSTVLLHIARQVFPDIEAVFVDTGLEYPEIKDFVKTFTNVTIIRPDMSFAEVIKEHGWCYPNKKVAIIIYHSRNGKKLGLKYFNEPLANPIIHEGVKHYKHLLNAPFKISDKCCDIMKKKPFKKYQKQTGKHPIIGTMAYESINRYRAWILTGCNAFNSREPKSTPLSFWTSADIKQYILLNNLKICSVYGSVVIDKKGKCQTTGEKRTGCIFCPIAMKQKINGKNRIQRLYDTHPKLYDYVLNKLNLKQLLDYENIDYKVN